MVTPREAREAMPLFPGSSRRFSPDATGIAVAAVNSRRPTPRVVSAHTFTLNDLTPLERQEALEHEERVRAYQRYLEARAREDIETLRRDDEAQAASDAVRAPPLLGPGYNLITAFSDF